MTAPVKMTDAEVEAFFAGKSEADIRRAISKARSDMALIESMQGVDQDNDWDGPFPPSKGFENWANGFGEKRVRLLRIGITESEQELTRRGLPV